MANSSYLVALFCASAGKNGEELGVDEEQIILFVYLLFDVPNNKVSVYLLSIFFTNGYVDNTLFDRLRKMTYRSSTSISTAQVCLLV